MSTRYKHTKISKDDKNTRHYGTTIYPVLRKSPNDIYVITGPTDRLDLLAHQYYKDKNLWWIIATVNNCGHGSLALEPGKQLRIPTNVGEYTQALAKTQKD